MKICFSSLACPAWTLDQVVNIAASSGYDGIELRFLEGEDSLWKLAAFQGVSLQTSIQKISDRGLSVACVDTSCRFHSPDPQERASWVEEGVRMAELASSLGSPGIRVFGDKIQPGADRASTRSWIADGLRELTKKTASLGVKVWLETHGDFASSEETMSILEKSGRDDIGVVWDAANAFIDGKDQALDGTQYLWRQTTARALERSGMQRGTLAACAQRRGAVPPTGDCGGIGAPEVRSLRLLRMGKEMASSFGGA